MKTLHYILCLALAGGTTAGHAQSSLQDQIQAVHEAHKSERKAQQKIEKQKRDATYRLQQREHKHEDALRELELEEKRIELEAKRTRAMRTNDFIDRELNMQDAQADLAKSKADSKRNLSEGAKNLLSGSSVKIGK